jgi:hypothetical protein
MTSSSEDSSEMDEYFDKLFEEEYDHTEKKNAEADKYLYEEDAAYIAAEEGRYFTYEDDDAMNYGIEQIDIDEMNGCTKEPEQKAIANDLVYEDYATPDHIKTRGSVNYHINKQQKAKTSPKSERRKFREKRAKDMRTKDSRCHKKQIHDL